MEIARWGSLTWEISARKLKPIQNVSASGDYDSDKKKKNNISFTLPYEIRSEFGYNVRKEIEKLFELRGSSHTLFINGKKFLAGYFKLTSVNASDISTDSYNGEPRSASISLTFEQNKKKKGSERYPKKKNIKKSKTVKKKK